MTDDKRKVVIIGAGFGGLAAARKMIDENHAVDVTVVDKNSYSTFIPLLYQVATGLITPDRIEFPVEKIVRHHHNMHFVQGEVTGVDFDAKRVQIKDQADLQYDYVVVAAGTTNNYFGNEDVEKAAYVMKSIDEAMEVRLHIIDSIIAARKASPEERKRLMSFVIVGGGPTGVEFAGALAVMARKALPKRFPEIKPEDITIRLLEGADALLAPFPKHIHKYTKKKLESLGVEVHLGEMVVDADENGVNLKSGKRFDCNTLFWAAGTKSVDFVGAMDVEENRGRILVDQKLRIPEYAEKGAYAIGDNALFTWKGSPLPAVSPPAMQEGRHVAQNILKNATWGPEAESPFHYIDKGTMATISRTSAVASVHGLQLTGSIGKAAWVGVHLYYLAGVHQRFKLMRMWFKDFWKYDSYLFKAVTERERDLEAAKDRTEAVSKA